MNYTEELLKKADDLIPRVKLIDFKNDDNSKVMIDLRQHEELLSSGSIKDALHVPKGVIEFRLNNNEAISFDTSVYVFCAVGIRSAIAAYNLRQVGYKKVFNLMGFQDILDQGAEKQSLI
jgi:rhodanese-related sulfurtransferase